MIQVASENLVSIDVESIDTITQGGKRYRVHGFYLIPKSDPFPFCLFRLATGVLIDPELVWKEYSKSDKIFLFVCDLISNNTKEVFKTTQEEYPIQNE